MGEFIDNLDVFFRLKTDGGYCDLATYTPRGGTAGDSFPVLLDENEEAVDVIQNAPDHGFTRAQVKTSDATTNSITAKNHAGRRDRDVITINGIAYGVLKVMTDKHGVTFLELERDIALKQ